MSDPYAEIRKLAEDETRLISAESYSTLRRFVLAALPVVEAMPKMLWSHGCHGPCEGNSCGECDIAYTQARDALARLKDPS